MASGRLCLVVVACFAPAAHAFSLAARAPTGRLAHPTVALAPARAALPTLGRRASVPHAQAGAATADDDSDNWPKFLPPRKELKKVLPLGVMFFFILVTLCPAFGDSNHARTSCPLTPVRSPGPVRRVRA